MTAQNTVKTLFFLFALPALCAAHLAEPSRALANGAAGWPGVRGNEIALRESAPIPDLTVDEEVVIDGRTDKVQVKYSIISLSKAAHEFRMVFPVGAHCSALASYKSIKPEDLPEKVLGFKAHLNDVELSYSDVAPGSIQLEGTYSQLRKEACVFLAFNVNVKPGKNVLRITYNLVPEGWEGDGVGSSWSYTYAIWPAKNWVSKFRHALWRIIPPWRVGGLLLMEREGEWYTDSNRRSYNTFKANISISAPGKRYDFPDYVEFRTYVLRPPAT